jgi:molybdate transport system ATP-binding protein
MVRAARAAVVGPMTLKVIAKKQRGGFTLDASFEVPTPGVVALFGRSGSGKSTLVNVIAGLLRPDRGVVGLNENTLLDTARHIDVPPERRRIGYVFQEARLFPHLGVAGNLHYAQRRATAKPFVTLERVVDLLDLSSLMDRKTQQLSGGERQRVAIGRALLTQPALLLLDEPLASLDASRREEVLPYLEILRDQLAIPMVYVSHNFDEALRLATHLVLMESGKTTAQGEIGEMSLNPSVRAIIGADAVGAIVEGSVLGADAGGLTLVRVGEAELKINTDVLAVGTKLRVQLLARDLIIAAEAPRRLSVRNTLRGTVKSIADDADDSDLIRIDIGGAIVMARVTKAATRDLGLAPGLTVWVLVKAVSLRNHLFQSRT